MKILKINKKHFISIDNIKKFVIKKDCVWVYKKSGYPPILKTTESLTILKKRLTNLLLTLNDFEVEYKIEMGK